MVFQNAILDKWDFKDSVYYEEKLNYFFGVYICNI